VLSTTFLDRPIGGRRRPSRAARRSPTAGTGDVGGAQSEDGERDERCCHARTPSGHLGNLRSPGYSVNVESSPAAAAPATHPAAPSPLRENLPPAPALDVRPRTVRYAAPCGSPWSRPVGLARTDECSTPDGGPWTAVASRHELAEDRFADHCVENGHRCPPTLCRADANQRVRLRPGAPPPPSARRPGLRRMGAASTDRAHMSQDGTRRVTGERGCLLGHRSNRFRCRQGQSWLWRVPCRSHAATTAHPCSGWGPARARGHCARDSIVEGVGLSRSLSSRYCASFAKAERDHTPILPLSRGMPWVTLREARITEE
jgi:hypothetical protein